MFPKVVHFALVFPLVTHSMCHTSAGRVNKDVVHNQIRDCEGVHKLGLR